MTDRTKALAISKEVKDAVFKRDGGKCILCGKSGLAEAHYIPRSQGGLGIHQS
jgi:5-methylcytosine-specific restriction endonuclease McrA